MHAPEGHVGLQHKKLRVLQKCGCLQNPPQHPALALTSVRSHAWGDPTDPRAEGQPDLEDKLLAMDPETDWRNEFRRAYEDVAAAQESMEYFPAQSAVGAWIKQGKL